MRWEQRPEERQRPYLSLWLRIHRERIHSLPLGTPKDVWMRKRAFQSEQIATAISILNSEEESGSRTSAIRDLARERATMRGIKLASAERELWRIVQEFLKPAER